MEELRVRVHSEPPDRARNLPRPEHLAEPAEDFVVGWLFGYVTDDRLSAAIRRNRETVAGNADPSQRSWPWRERSGRLCCASRPEGPTADR